jgi:hypothetical protein
MAAPLRPHQLRRCRQPHQSNAPWTSAKGINGFDPQIEPPPPATNFGLCCERINEVSAVLGTSAWRSIVQLIEKLLRCNQIGGAETLRKAVIDRLEAGGGVGGAALMPQQASEARRGAQLP